MIPVGSMVTLRSTFADRAENLCTGHRCEDPRHRGVLSRGTLALVLEFHTDPTPSGLHSARVVVPDGRSGWIRHFYLEVL